jgi:hypothetical protein
VTNRRSMPNFGERMSRQTQFLPGHVGGRVASAQPVRDRRTIGATGATPATPPTGILPVAARGTDLAGATLPAFPEGMTSAVAIAACSGASDLILPAGWDVILDCGPTGAPSGGGRIEQTYILAITNPTGTEGRDVHMDAGSITSGWGATVFAGAYFTGGTGGHWSAVEGAVYTGSAIASPAEIPPGTPAWVQFGAIHNVYTPAYEWYSEMAHGTGPGTGFYLWPATDGAVMPEVPWTDDLTWGTIGTYGDPHSNSLAAIWSP